MGDSLGNLGDGSFVEEGSGTGASTYRGPTEGPGEGGFRLPGTLRIR